MHKLKLNNRVFTMSCVHNVVITKANERGKLKKEKQAGGALESVKQNQQLITIQLIPTRVTGTYSSQCTSFSQSRFFRHGYYSLNFAPQNQ